MVFEERTRKQICRLCWSIITAVCVIITLVVMVDNWNNIVSTIITTGDTSILFFHALPYTSKWVLIALFWVFVVVIALDTICRDRYMEEVTDKWVLIIMSAAMGLVTYTAFALLSPFAGNDTWMYWIEPFWTTSIPAGIILLTVLLYNSSLFKFCGRLDSEK